MIFPLKYNTASQEVPLGFFLDTSTGNIEQTSLTIANTDIKLWKSGATTLANKNSGGATHISNGIYYCVLDATDTNTYGPLEIFIHVSGALAFHKVCTVINSDVYDALMSTSSGSIRSTVTAMSAGVITSTAIADELFYTSDQVSQDVWSYTTRTLTSSGTATVNAADVWSYSSRTLSGDQSFILIGNVSGNVNGSVGSVIGAVGSVAGNVSGSVGSVTGNVAGSVGSVVGAVGSVAGNVSGSVASVTGNVAGSVASVVGAVGSVAGNVSGSVGSVSGLTNSTITTAVWAASSRTLSGNQSFTLIGNISGNVTGSVGSVTTVNDKTGYSLAVSPPTSSTIAQAVWGNALSRTLSGSQSFNLSGNILGNITGNVEGNVNGSVGSVTNGATLSQINSLVSGIRGSDNDSLKTLSDQLDVVTASGTTPAAIWSYSSRSLSGNQSFTLIGNVSGNITGSVGSVTTVSDKTGYSLAATQTYTMIGNVSGSVASVVGNVGGNVVGSVASVTGAVGSVAGNVSGSVASVTGAVGSVAGNVSGSVGSVVGSVGSVTGAVGSVAGNVSGSVGSVTGAVGSVAGNVSGSVASVTGNVSGSVGSVVNGATLTQINSLVSGIRGTDNDSLKTVSDQIDSISVSGSTPAEIWGYGTRTLTTNIPTVQEIVDGVWDELMVNHTSTGTTGNQLATMGTSAGAITIDPSSIWNYATRTITGGTIDTVSGNVNGSVGSVLGNISGNVIGSVGSVAGNVSGSVGSVLGDINGNVSGYVGRVVGNVSGSVASVVNGATLTQINSLVSGIRGTDNDSIKTISDQLDSISGATPATIWSYSSRSLSGNQSFTLIGNVSGSVGSVTSPVTVGTNNDKTNYSLSATQTFTHIGNVSGNVTGSVGSVTTVNDKTGYSLSSTQTYTLIGNVSGNVNGSVGSVVGSVGSVAGNVSGSVASVVNGATLTQINSLVSGIRGTDNDSLKTLSDQVDNVTVSGATAQAIWEYTNRTLTSSGTAAIDYTQVANAVWDELLSLHTVSGSAGKQLSSTVTSSGAVYVNIAGAEIADAVWNAETATYNVAGSMGRALTSTGTAVIDASDVWNYGTRTLTSSTGNATLANQEIIINHLTDIKGDGWTDEDLVAIMTAIENGTWGGFGV